MTNLQAEILKLSADEKLALLDVLWESIEGEVVHLDDSTPLTNEQSAELTRRIAQSQANPGEMVPWEQVKENLLQRLEKR